MTSHSEAEARTAKARRLAEILAGYGINAGTVHHLSEQTWETLDAIDAHRQGRGGYRRAPSPQTRRLVAVFLPAADTMTDADMEEMFG